MARSACDSSRADALCHLRLLRMLRWCARDRQHLDRCGSRSSTAAATAAVAIVVHQPSSLSVDCLVS